MWSEADWQAFVNGVGDMRARLEVIEGSAITDEQEIGIIAIPAGAGQNGRIQNAVFAGDAKPSWLTYGANGQFTITGRFPGEARWFAVEARVDGAAVASEPRAIWPINGSGGGNQAVVAFNDNAYVVITLQTEGLRNQPRYLVNTYGDGFVANSTLALYVLYGGRGPQGQRGPIGPPGEAVDSSGWVERTTATMTPATAAAGGAVGFSALPADAFGVLPLSARTLDLLGESYVVNYVARQADASLRLEVTDATVGNALDRFSWYIGEQHFPLRDATRTVAGSSTRWVWAGPYGQPVAGENTDAGWGEPALGTGDIHAGDGVTVAERRTGGVTITASADERILDPSPALAAPDDQPQGRVRSFGADLYINEPIPGASAVNRADGTASQSNIANVYTFRETPVHDPDDSTIFEWYNQAGALPGGLTHRARLRIGRRHAGTAPPATLYVRVTQGSITAQYQMVRDAAAEPNNSPSYYYDYDGTTPFTAGAGDTYLETYTDASYSAAYAIKNGLHWQRYPSTAAHLPDGTVIVGGTPAEGQVITRIAGNAWGARTPDYYRPPQKALDFDRAVSGDGWVDDGGVSAPQQAAPTAFGSLVFQPRRPDISPRVTNYYVAIRVPLDQKDNLANWRLGVFPADPATAPTIYPASGWTHVEDDPAYALYYQQVADIPVGNGIAAQQLDPLIMNRSEVRFDRESHEIFNATFTLEWAGAAQEEARPDFAPAVDLDMYGASVIELFQTVEFTERASNAVGFAPHSDTTVPNPDTSITRDTRQPARRVLASTPYAAGVKNGVELWTAEVYEGTGDLGQMTMLLDRDAQNVCRPRLVYDRVTGGASAAFTATVTMIGVLWYAR